MLLDFVARRPAAQARSGVRHDTAPTAPVTRAALECTGTGYYRSSPFFGNLPHWSNRNFHLAASATEKHEFLAEHGVALAPVQDRLAEALVACRLKFGVPLSEWLTRMSAAYPALTGRRSSHGNVIVVSGLPACGKSLLGEALRDRRYPHLVVIDSDAVRYNLLGPPVRECEANRHLPLPILHLMLHNRLLSSIHAVFLTAAADILRSRGYLVVWQRTTRQVHADHHLWLDHYAAPLSLLQTTKPPNTEAIRGGITNGGWKEHRAFWFLSRRIAAATRVRALHRNPLTRIPEQQVFRFEDMRTVPLPVSLIDCADLVSQTCRWLSPSIHDPLPRPWVLLPNRPLSYTTDIKLVLAAQFLTTLDSRGVQP